jgi:hypothetical protein
VTREELDALWRDPDSWRAWSVYVQPDDPRVIVPKQVRWTGYTMNFANPLAVPVLVVVSVLVSVPFLFPFLIKPRCGLGWTLASFGMIVAAVIALCHWKSTRSRT